MRAFVVQGLVFSIPSQEIGLGERLRNDLFRVDRDVKPELNAIRYDTRCYFNVRSKANTSQLNLPHGTATTKKCKNRKRTKSRKQKSM